MIFNYRGVHSRVCVQPRKHHRWANQIWSR